MNYLLGPAQARSDAAAHGVLVAAPAENPAHVPAAAAAAAAAAADAAAAAAELPCARQPKKAHAAVFAVAVRVTVHHDQEHALQRVDCAQN